MQYPFLSYLSYGGNDYIGIIQNTDNDLTTIYDFGMIKTLKEKKDFLECGDIWWNESNRQIPINIFLRTEWFQFKDTLRTLISKDVEIKYGPQTNMRAINETRSKRKNITLIRRAR